MKILILNDVAATVGGAETLTLDLRDEFRLRGHDARIFASDVLGGAAASGADYSCFGTTGGFRTLNRVANPRAWLALRSALAEFRPDVVHVRMFMTQLSPLVLSLLAGIPSLYHAAWYETICPIGLRLLPDESICEFEPGRACLSQGCLSRRAWVALMAQRALWDRWRGVFSLFVANSGAMERRLRAHGIGPTRVIWNGVPMRSPRPPLSAPPLVAYAGRFSWEKGVGILVDAFAKVQRVVPAARLLLVGDGPDRARLIARANELGIAGEVTWAGHLDREAMERELEPAWVVAAPSLLEEPFGLSAAEAMMRGTAVVVSSHGGLAEIVRDGQTGVHVPPRDAEALAAALASLLSNPARCELLGARGHTWAKEALSQERCADRFLDAYADIQAGVAA